MMLDKIHIFFTTGTQRTLTVKRNIIYSFFIKGISILVSFILVPLTIDFVNSVQYGIWLTVSSLVGWFAYFDMGLTHGFRNKFAAAIARKDDSLAREYVSTTYAVLTIIFITILLLALWVNSYLDWSKILGLDPLISEELSRVFGVLIIFFCLNAILNVFTTLLLALQKTAMSSLILVISQLAILFVIFVLTKTATGSLLMLTFVFSGIQCLVLLVISIVLFATRFRKYIPKLSYVNFKLFKSIFGLGIKFFIIQLALLAIFQTSNIILSRVLGPEAVTIYNVCYKYFFAINMLLTIILTPYWSAFTDAYTVNDTRWMISTYRSLSRIWCIVALGAVAMLFVSPLFYHFWLGGLLSIPYSLSIAMFLYVVVMSRASLYMYLLNGIGTVNIQMIIYLIFGVVSIPLMILLCRGYGIIGILMVTTLVYLIQCCFGHIQLKKILNTTAKGIWLK
ncbi:lipopolysaccharide biosynthesis protein [Butyricimonas virosa]|jgi:polysaccharide biosynthesis protein|nr:oligosaccharide flippase family protein [Butyricimonas virosa]